MLHYKENMLQQAAVIRLPYPQRNIRTEESHKKVSMRYFIFLNWNTTNSLGDLYVFKLIIKYLWNPVDVANLLKFLLTNYET